MPNDLTRLVMERACERFGDKQTFNAANFANAMRETSGMAQTLDGRMVRAMLTGRQDVEVLPGNHYRLNA